MRFNLLEAGVSGRLPKIGILSTEVDGHNGVGRRPDRDAFAESLDSIRGAEEIELVESGRMNPWSRGD